MNTLFNQSIDNIDENDLKDLVDTRKVREYVGLDYKRTSYAHDHTGVVNLLADITAMANSRGGYIIIGVEEDTNAPDGTPKCLVGIDNGDTEANWIQSVSLSSIDETIVGLRVRDIGITNGKHCIIIQVPNSTKKPHMIVHEKHRSFRTRHGRANAFIGMREVRDMVINMTSYQASLISFTQERTKLNFEIADSAPFLLLSATPIYIGSDRLNPLEKDYCDLLEKVPGVPDGNYEGIKVGNAKPRIFGIEVIPYGRPINGAHKKYSRLFRNGHLEFYENYSPSHLVDWPNKAMPIYSYRIAVSLLHFLLIAQQVYNISEITDPIVLNLIMGNVAPSYIHPYDKGNYFPDEVFTWTEKFLPIDMTVSELNNLNSIASELMDRFFNAYGVEKNSHFNEKNELIRSR